MNVEQLLALADSQLVQALAALAMGATGTYHQYRKTGRIPLSSLPWTATRRLLYTLRRKWFTVERPDTNVAVVDATIDEIRDRLAIQSYNPGWPLSYHYYGEDLNARRYYYDPTRPYAHRQLHIRGFETPDGVELVAHEEPAPEHHPRAHLKEVDMHDATTWVETAWSEGDLDPRSFQRHD